MLRAKPVGGLGAIMARRRRGVSGRAAARKRHHLVQQLERRDFPGGMLPLSLMMLLDREGEPAETSLPSDSAADQTSRRGQPSSHRLSSQRHSDTDPVEFRRDQTPHRNGPLSTEPVRTGRQGLSQSNFDRVTNADRFTPPVAGDRTGLSLLDAVSDVSAFGSMTDEAAMEKFVFEPLDAIRGGDSAAGGGSRLGSPAPEAAAAGGAAMGVAATDNGGGGGGGNLSNSSVDGADEPVAGGSVAGPDAVASTEPSFSAPPSDSLPSSNQGSGMVAADGAGTPAVSQDSDVSDLADRSAVAAEVYRLGPDQILVRVSGVGPLGSDATITTTDTASQGRLGQFTAVSDQIDSSTGVIQRVIPAGPHVETVRVDWTFGGSTGSSTINVAIGSDSDGDGMSDFVEALHAGGDANDDGIPDAEQATIASVPDAKSGEFVTIVSGQYELRQVRSTDTPRDSMAARRLPFGMFGFDLVGVPVGETAVVDLHVPTDWSLSGYYKQDASGDLQNFFYNGQTGAVIDGSRVNLHLRDGGRGDSDGVADGVIRDPGAGVGGVVEITPGQPDPLSGWGTTEYGGMPVGRGPGR